MRAGTPAWPGTTLECPEALERCWWRVCFISYWLFPLVFKTLVMEWLAGNRTSSMKLIMKYITVLCSCQFDRHVSHPWFCQCEQLFCSFAAEAVQQRREIFYSSVFFSPKKKKKKSAKATFFRCFFSPFSSWSNDVRSVREKESAFLLNELTLWLQRRQLFMTDSCEQDLKSKWNYVTSLNYTDCVEQIHFLGPKNIRLLHLPSRSQFLHNSLPTPPPLHLGTNRFLPNHNVFLNCRVLDVKVLTHREQIVQFAWF